MYDPRDVTRYVKHIVKAIDKKKITMDEAIKLVKQTARPIELPKPKENTYRPE